MSKYELSEAITEYITSREEHIEHELKSRAVRCANELRNAELEVLRGERHGRVYKVPKSTRTYTASAPGEPPARRTGNLRLHWTMDVRTEDRPDGCVIDPGIVSGEQYSLTLENGTSRTAPRPYKDLIVKKAMPKIKSICEEGW